MIELSIIRDDDTNLVGIHVQDKKYLQLGHRLLQKYGSKTHTGGTRKVFFSKKCVIKMPLNRYSESINIQEYKLSKTDKNKYAKCRLVVIDNVPVLFMEKLTIDIHDHNLPEWCHELVDGNQVGFDKKGNIKVYDYAMEKK